MRPDFIDHFRHWLIRKLSCGDMILMNFEIDERRLISTTNLGPSLFTDARICVVENGYGIAVGLPTAKATMSFRHLDWVRFKDCSVVTAKAGDA